MYLNWCLTLVLFGVASQARADTPCFKPIGASEYEAKLKSVTEPVQSIASYLSPYVDDLRRRSPNATFPIKFGFTNMSNDKDGKGVSLDFACYSPLKFGFVMKSTIHRPGRADVVRYYSAIESAIRPDPKQRNIVLFFGRENDDIVGFDLEIVTNEVSGRVRLLNAHMGNIWP